jgi:hypothetical protein
VHLRSLHPFQIQKSRELLPRAGEDMTTRTDRRNDTRVNVRTSLRFKLIGNQTAGEQLAESANLSQRGVFMWTAYPLKMGAQVELRLRMPNEISGFPASEVQCTARVVRIQESDSAGLLGVGLQIERYHATGERERWAS